MSTARQIDQTYVKTGQVRIVSKNLPVHGEQAAKMAEAALCAADQGKYWYYHDRLLENLYVGNLTALAPTSLSRHATDLGLNVSAFSSCLESGKYTQRVADETAEAQRLGITGTPTFLVNSTKIVGAQPFQTFKTAIDAALKQ